MPKERQPIFDVETDRPSHSEILDLENKRREKEELSQPIPHQSREELMQQYPDITRIGDEYVSENDKDRIVFDSYGREIEHTVYKKLHRDYPSAFDVQSRVRAEYDNEGYLSSVTRMEVGKYGFRKKYVYAQSDNGNRELKAILTYKVQRYGLMDPGPNIGEPVVVDFSDIK